MSTPRFHFSMEALMELCRRYHAHELALFGSARREDFGADTPPQYLVGCFHLDAMAGL
jgi:hypothetical protein